MGAVGRERAPEDGAQGTAAVGQVQAPVDGAEGLMGLEVEVTEIGQVAEMGEEASRW